ncbi:trimethylamine methyltransferase family protein [Sagittula stellata E-37]|uniref:Trimethylamine methyltransferase family protein n=1 Tax=Sagittula stellata (strain ATCC 700073 / DSM 11524 / E-37) TaxID=388399 RepID=A3K6W5_SAGS3|nr:trimethylamine methyltransferase family protein [Sagittula stellata E-37]
MRATQMTGQMARHYGLPMRSSGACTANVPDGQAMWETGHALRAAVQSGTHLVCHVVYLAAGRPAGSARIGPAATSRPARPVHDRCASSWQKYL